MTKTRTINVAGLPSSRVRELLQIASPSPTCMSYDAQTEKLLIAILNNSKLVLQPLLADLKLPVITEEFGPLSFRRLTRINNEEAVKLDGKPFIRALTSSRTTPKALRCLAEYGRILSQQLMPQSTRHTGSIIRILAVTALRIRHNLAITDLEIQELQRLLQAIRGSDAFPQSVRTYVARATTQIKLQQVRQ